MQEWSNRFPKTVRRHNETTTLKEDWIWDGIRNRISGESYFQKQSRPPTCTGHEWHLKTFANWLISMGDWERKLIMILRKDGRAVRAIDKWTKVQCQQKWLSNWIPASQKHYEIQKKRIKRMWWKCVKEQKWKSINVKVNKVGKWSTLFRILEPLSGAKCQATENAIELNSSKVQRSAGKLV